MAASIEIEYSEYKALKDEIERLNKLNVTLEKKCEEKDNIIGNISIAIEELSTLSLFDRIFLWAKKFNLIIDNIKND